MKETANSVNSLQLSFLWCERIKFLISWFECLILCKIKSQIYYWFCMVWIQMIGETSEDVSLTNCHILCQNLDVWEIWRYGCFYFYVYTLLHNKFYSKIEHLIESLKLWHENHMFMLILFSFENQFFLKFGKYSVMILSHRKKLKKSKKFPSQNKRIIHSLNKPRNSSLTSLAVS